jgi:hypothetical protein
MAIATSGSIALSTVHSVFGRGYAISGYLGVGRYTAAGYAVFPSSNFPFSAFWGTSPSDEWNCACNCNCGACGK